MCYTSRAKSCEDSPPPPPLPAAPVPSRPPRDPATSHDPHEAPHVHTHHLKRAAKAPATCTAEAHVCLGALLVVRRRALLRRRALPRPPSLLLPLPLTRPRWPAGWVTRGPCRTHPTQAGAAPATASLRAPPSRSPSCPSKEAAAGKTIHGASSGLGRNTRAGGARFNT